MGDKQVITTEKTVSRSELSRLKTLTDCVYAVALVLIIQWLPVPSESTSATDTVWLLDLFVDHLSNLVAVLVAVAFVVMYWLRSNLLMALQDRTDAVHTAFSIVSVFFLLFLLYSVRIGQEIAAPSRRATESVAVALIGLAGAAAFRRARKKGLIRDGVPRKRLSGVQVEALTEPLTALVTLPFAYVGEISWNLAWLAYLPIAALLRRRSPEEDKGADGGALSPGRV